MPSCDSGVRRRERGRVGRFATLRVNSRPARRGQASARLQRTGLGGMVMCATRITKAGGAMKLIHLNRRNLELIVLTKLDTIFQVFEDETDAVNSFFPDRQIKKFDILAFVRNLKDD